MKQCMDEENLHRRLRKIIGQVQAIDRMIEEDVPCEDVITQVNAAKSALHKVGQIILEGFSTASEMVSSMVMPRRRSLALPKQ